MNEPSSDERRYPTLVVQYWRRPGKYWTATIVRECSTVAAAFEYLGFVELTLTAANSTAGGDAPSEASNGWTMNSD